MNDMTFFIPRLALVLFTAGIMFCADIRPAGAEDAKARGNADTVYHADLVTGINPEGIMLVVGGFRKWSGPLDHEYGMPSSSNQLGFTLGVSPAYAQASVYDEWKPALFAQVRLQYDLYRFFGENGALLSFPSAGSKFGKREIDALSGREEAGWGQRIMLRPVITAKAGPVIIRNTSDLCYFRFGGRGPYFLEWEYDSLLKNGDFLLNNRTAFLMEAWKGEVSGKLFAGPFYEITHASSAGITRQRSGVQAFWSPTESIGAFNNPRVYGQVGMNLQDRNRDSEAFFAAGVGLDF